MTTLLLSPRYTEDSIAVRAAALRIGWKVRRLPTWRPSEDLVAIDAVPYGEPLFVASVCQFLGLAPLEPRFDWLAGLDRRFTKREITFSTLGVARTLTGSLFIKPADDKCFKAKVYDKPEELPGADLVPESTPVLVSTPVEWQLEFRAFVSEGRIRTMSPYLRAGSLAKTDDGDWAATEDEWNAARLFLSTVLADDRIDLPPGAVVDVGLIKDLGWAVVEANPGWGSGIYGCDPAEVCLVARTAIRPMATLSAEDKRWIPPR